MPDRAPGFYWVRVIDERSEWFINHHAEWLVAQYVPGDLPWGLPGDDFYVTDSYFAEIGPRVESPEEMRAGGHRTRWEDSGVAAVMCNGQDAGSLMAGEEPEPCSVCGQSIRLRWDVRVEVVGQAAAREGT